MHLYEHYIKTLFTLWANAWSINEALEAYQSGNWWVFLSTLMFALLLGSLSLISARRRS